MRRFACRGSRVKKHRHLFPLPPSFPPSLAAHKALARVLYRSMGSVKGPTPLGPTAPVSVSREGGREGGRK